MFRYWVLIFFLGMGALLYGQTSNNPFDLKYRPARSKEQNKIIKPVQPVDTSSILQPPPGTTGSPGKIEEDTSIINLGKRPQDTSAAKPGTNPFNIATGQDTGQKVTAIAIPQDTANSKVKSIVPPALVRNSSKGFQIFFLLLSLLFLIFIVNVERNYVRDLWRVISNENYSSLHHRNQRNTMRQILLMMGYAVFIFQAGIFIYHALRILGYHGPVKINIWIPMFFVLGVYIIRHGVIRYLRWLFNNQKEMTLFGFDISIFNTMVGLILLPINVLLLFGPESMYKPLIIIGILAFAAAYFLRQLRWILTARGLISHSLFLFFIYLCAVEILPLWALSKFFW